MLSKALTLVKKFTATQYVKKPNLKVVLNTNKNVE